MKLLRSRQSTPPADEPPTLQLAEGVSIAGRFRLIRKLGEGGMGSVWLAQHLALGIPCAMKFVDGQARIHPELVARFELEAKVEAQLRSPHVVQVFDHGIWQGVPYIAMEYLEGESLADRLYRLGHLNPELTYRIVAHVARALTQAHALGIVHRDLKPENIFVVPGDDGEMIKVLDFGVAKFTTGWSVSRVTKTGLLVGTPLYMSPEQARGTREIDGRADLWSVAVIAYQCLTGNLPFMSEGLGDLLAKIMFDPIPRPTETMRDLPPEVDGWWLIASSRDLDSRFQTAKELADSFGKALGMSHVINIADIPVGLHAERLSQVEISISERPAVIDEAPIPQKHLIPDWLVQWVSANRRLTAAAAFGVLLTLILLFARGGADPARAEPTVTPGTRSTPETSMESAERRDPRGSATAAPAEGAVRTGIRTDDLPSAPHNQDKREPQASAPADTAIVRTLPIGSEAPRHPSPPPKAPPKSRDGAPASKVDFGI